MSMVLPCDVDTALADRYQMQIMLSHTKKPIVFITYDFEGWLVAVRMAEIVAGGEDQLRQKPNIMGYVNITTGLRHNKDSLQKLLLLSGKGLPTIYAPDVYKMCIRDSLKPSVMALDWWPVRLMVEEEAFLAQCFSGDSLHYNRPVSYTHLI